MTTPTTAPQDSSLPTGKSPTPESPTPEVAPQDSSLPTGKSPTPEDPLVVSFNYKMYMSIISVAVVLIVLAFAMGMQREANTAHIEIQKLEKALADEQASKLAAVKEEKDTGIKLVDDEVKNMDKLLKEEKLEGQKLLMTERANAVKANVAEYYVVMNEVNPVVTFRYRTVAEIADRYANGRVNDRPITADKTARLPEPIEIGK